MDIDINELVSNRKSFNDLVYTPLDDAIELLKQRQQDSSIIIPKDVPDFLDIGNNAVLSRHITTPNHENIRFIEMVRKIGFKPIFWEYNDDFFVSNNKLKHALGKIHIFLNKDDNHGINTRNLTIVDFNDSNGKKMSELKTSWGQSLVDFHHEMLLKKFPDIKESIFDASQWFNNNGGESEKYYKSLLYPFIKHGILFENFLLDNEEMPLTRNVVIPAIKEIFKETGLKPLIVALEPTDIETDKFWLCHPHETEEFIISKLKKLS
ncbi:MAG: hypothetical protein ABL899_00165 [Nitrospira sp.]